MIKFLLVLLLALEPFTLLQAQYYDNHDVNEETYEEPVYEDEAYEGSGNDDPEDETYDERPAEQEFPEEYNDRPVEDGDYDTSPQESFDNYEDTQGYDDY